MTDHWNNLCGPNPAPAGSELWKLYQREYSLQSPVTEKTTQGITFQRTKPGALREDRQGICFETRTRGIQRVNEVLLLHYIAGIHQNSCLEGSDNCYGPMITIYFSFLFFPNGSLSCFYSTTVYWVHGEKPLVHLWRVSEILDFELSSLGKRLSMF